MISKILVATDGSETAMKAAKFAVSLARQVNASITLLSVIDRSLFISLTIPKVATPTHLIEPIEDFLRQAAEAYMEEIVTLCERSGIQAETVVKSGHPVDEIIKGAEKSKADLIVMGSHGRNATEAAILGSVTFGVIHKDAKIPVLVVRR
ncbi:MAG: universal stress protein [Nitrospirota bacterium]